MGADVVGGANESLEEITQSKRIDSLVVNDVKVLKRTIVVDVPKYKEVDQIKYNTKEQQQTEFITTQKETLKFIPREVPTIKFIPKEEQTIKYKLVEQEYEVERPVLKDKMYERPVIRDKVYEVISYKDTDAIALLVELVPTLMKELKELKVEMDKLKEYKLVEEVVKVPKINYIPREEERIVWKDVPRERCEKCKEEVK